MQLSGKHILITRPEPENTLSCERFQTWGAHSLSLPMIEIDALTEQNAAIQSHIFDLDLYDQVIFISKNAVRYGIEWIEDCWPMLPVGINWVGIGKGTTDFINELGFDLGIKAQEHALSGNTSEALLNQESMQKVSGQKILIMGGEGGRTKLADTLLERGAQVKHLALYSRNKINYDLEQVAEAENCEVILITSGEGLENLVDTLSQHNKNWLHKLILTPSQRVTDMAIELGWKNVVNANGADDNSIYAALTQL